MECIVCVVCVEMGCFVMILGFLMFGVFVWELFVVGLLLCCIEIG